MESKPIVNRVPGKYVVWVMGAIVTVFMIVAVVLALRVGPAAERFKTNHPNPSSLRP